MTAAQLLRASLAIGALAMLVSPPAPATTIVAYYTSKAVWLGADSKWVESDLRDAHPELRDAGFHCKISVDGGYAWASTGTAIVLQGTVVAGKAITIPRGALARAPSFDAAVSQLTGYVLQQLPPIARDDVAHGWALNAHPDLVFAGTEDGAARLSISGPGRNLFGHRAYIPIECRPGGGVDCQDGFLFRLGYSDRIDAILQTSSGSALVATRGPAGAIRYLISEEEHAHPRYVGGPISILRLDRSGIHWIDRGLCH